IKGIVDSYREKRDGMLAALEEFMPKEITWTKPEGGLFLFVTCPEYIDTNELFKKAIEKNVAFVSGTSFYCDGGGKNTMRLNFSFCSKETNYEGIKRLAEAIKSELR
ncbi:MAG: aminotransferase class I/II-fold pyridoxal phosphate-dependent enzyme, partial [Candidatus Cloacimonetes bacterium]|nr:aminotransferase class I/II-fold pyridoxal phosphate-dependent enzyme [Candidatus Cloacimonadota bacterium]